MDTRLAGCSLPLLASDTLGAGGPPLHQAGAMMDPITTVRCRNCGSEIEDAPGTPVEQRSPCPNCGSRDRSFVVESTINVGVHFNSRLKGRAGRSGNPFIEAVSGASFHRAEGVWKQIERVIDRRNNRYREKITDGRGNVIRDVDEPLSEHQGHGSAKRAKQPTNSPQEDSDDNKGTPPPPRR